MPAVCIRDPCNGGFRISEDSVLDIHNKRDIAASGRGGMAAPTIVVSASARARGADVRAQPKRPASATAVGVLDVPGRAVASRRWQ